MLGLLAALPLCAAAATPAPATDATWTRAFAVPGPPSTSAASSGQAGRLESDPRFATLLQASFPQRQFFWYDHWKLTPLPEMIQMFMSIPGDAILDDNRYVTVDGCVVHDCDSNRGMLWIDTGTHPATLIFAGINPITSGAPPFENHLWVFTSQKLNWQHMPPGFMTSLHRWLPTIGANGYRGTNGYRYNFSIETIVQPRGVMVDLGPDILGLSPSPSQTGAGS
jgi:hypothetical protein